MRPFRPLAPLCGCLLLACATTPRAPEPAPEAPATEAPAAAPAAPARSEAQKLDALLAEYWEEYLRLNPVAATAIGDPRYNNLFPNSLAPEFRAQTQAAAEKWLAALRAIDRSKLEGQSRLSYDILAGDLEEELAGRRFPSHLIPIQQFGSVPSFFAVLASGKSLQPFQTVKDYEDFLERGDGAVAWMDQAIVNMREGMKAGVTQPKVVMQKVLPQLAAHVQADPTKTVHWGAVAAMPKDFSPADRARLEQAYREAITQRWVPAYKRLHDFVKGEYLPRCRDTVAWSALPQGAEWYAFNVKASTTTDLAPADIHETGLKEVQRIRDEMDRVRKQVGFKGDLQAFFKHLETDPKFYFTKEEELLEGYRALQQRINALLPKLFDVFPKADYEVRAIEPFRAASSAGAMYQRPSPDGARPGIFYVNTHNLKAQPRFIMETLSIHEASPGHHFQSAIAQEVQGLPAYRRFGTGYVAYSEGWALYAESLGKELGLFTDPYQWYGRLSDEQLRAMRLVVDTGLHHKGWSREKAIAFMRQNSSMAESDIVSEVERYIVIPGQALGYKVGEFQIRALRNEAQAALGERFDVRAFHRQVLTDGPLPMDVLATKVREWIAAEKAKVAQR
jgi:uncharacterized protein (DUF885 family)